MKVQFVKLGRISEPLFHTLVAEYEKRLRAYCDVSSQILKNELVFVPGAFYIALDERGHALSSPALAEKLAQWRLDPAIKTICFVVGGPYGLDDSQRASCQFLWSLSAGTFTSDMAWLIVWEQVYRSLSILHGSAYHHG